ISVGVVLEKINYWCAIISHSQSSADEFLPIRPRSERLVCWNLDEFGRSVLNLDSFVINRGGSAAVGAAIRDDCSRCIAAYSINLGSCSITRAEIREAVDGMKIAWELGIRRLAIQVDSTCVIDILTDTSNSSHQHSRLVTLF
ncbi:Putative ribonuclease H protein At1g65750, partial [Linum perenne]